MHRDLSPEKALIFRITHRDNMAWILTNGLHCRNSEIVDPNYVEIGNPALIESRNLHPLPCPPGGTLSDYVPFYFTPFSPMLYNIKTGHAGIRKRNNEEIVILSSSLHALKERNVRFLFTDRHADVEAAQFSCDLARLDWIDWATLRKRDFKKDDVNKFQCYQAEALAHKHVPIDALSGIVCYNESITSRGCRHYRRSGA